MSDAALRALEKRWLETGDSEVEVALLRERLRVGRGVEPIRLAAYLGHAPAIRALDGPPPAVPSGEGFPGVSARKLWAWGLEPWERPAHLRAALAAVERWLPAGDEELLRAAILTARRYARDPSRPLTEAVGVFERADAACEGAYDADLEPSLAQRCARDLGCLLAYPDPATGLSSEDGGPDLRVVELVGFLDAQGAPLCTLPGGAHTANFAGNVLDVVSETGVDDAALFASIRAELVPWALGW